MHGRNVEISAEYVHLVVMKTRKEIAAEYGCFDASSAYQGLQDKIIATAYATDRRRGKDLLDPKLAAQHVQPKSLIHSIQHFKNTRT